MKTSKKLEVKEETFPGLPGSRPATTAVSKQTKKKIMDSDDEETKISAPKQPVKEQPKPAGEEIIVVGGKKGRGKRKQETVEIKGAFY